MISPSSPSERMQQVSEFLDELRHIARPVVAPRVINAASAFEAVHDPIPVELDLAGPLDDGWDAAGGSPTGFHPVGKAGLSPRQG